MGIEAFMVSDVALTAKLTVKGCGGWTCGFWLEPEAQPEASKSRAASPRANPGRRCAALRACPPAMTASISSTRTSIQIVLGNRGLSVGARGKVCAAVLPARTARVTWVGPLPAGTVSGLNPQLHPAGRPEQESAMAEVRVPAWPTVSGKVAVPPEVTLPEVCGAVSEIPFTTCVKGADALP